MLLTLLLPFLAWQALGAAEGCCLFHAKGERCFGYGFGMVLLAPLQIIWIVAGLMGYFLQPPPKPDN
jgi:hypothetical protein